MKNNTYNTLIKICIFTLTITPLSSCLNPSECDFDKYESNCVDGYAHNCERTTSEGDEWVIDVYLCGHTSSDGSTYGPKCITVERSTNNKRPYAICSFDESPNEHCKGNVSYVCPDGEFYECHRGIRDLKKPKNDYLCEDKAQLTTTSKNSASKL